MFKQHIYIYHPIFTAYNWHRFIIYIKYKHVCVYTHDTLDLGSSSSVLWKQKLDWDRENYILPKSTSNRCAFHWSPGAIWLYIYIIYIYLFVITKLHGNHGLIFVQLQLPFSLLLTPVSTTPLFDHPMAKVLEQDATNPENHRPSPQRQSKAKPTNAFSLTWRWFNMPNIASWLKHSNHPS